MHGQNQQRYHQIFAGYRLLLISVCFVFSLSLLTGSALLGTSRVDATPACTYKAVSATSSEVTVYIQNNFAISAVRASTNYFNGFDIAPQNTLDTLAGGSHIYLLYHDYSAELVAGIYSFQISTSTGDPTVSQINSAYLGSPVISEYDAGVSDQYVCTYDSGLSLGSPPSAVTLSGTVAGLTEIDLSWSAGGATSYVLDQDGTPVYSGASNSYNDTGLANNTTYTYLLTATNSVGSTSSTALNLTTLADTGLTVRDINIAGLAIACLIGYFTIKQFAFRGRS